MARFAHVTKANLVEDINGLLGDCLSLRTEIALKKLSMAELLDMKKELDSGLRLRGICLDGG